MIVRIYLTKVSKKHTIDFMHIQRKHCELVLALYQYDTLVDVAEHLYMTPSALSHQLKELERQLGAPVVNRKIRPLNLTAEGQRILDFSRDILPRFELMEGDLSRMLNGDSGRLNIAIECHSCYRWLLPTIHQFHEKYPDVELDLSGGFSFDGLAGLVSGELDCVVTADPESLHNITYIPLFQYESVLLMPATHALSQKATIKPSDLSDQTLIIYPVSHHKMDIFRLFLNPAQITPQHIRTSEQTIMMIALIASGRGLCALPNWAADEYTEEGFIITKRMGDGIFNTLYAAVRKNSLELKYMQDFLYLAKDIPFSTLAGIAQPARK